MIAKALLREYADELDAVTWDICFEFVLVFAQVFLTPEVADATAAFDFKVAPCDYDSSLDRRDVEQADGLRAVFHVLGHDEILIGPPDDRGLPAQRILIDLNNLGVAKDIQREIVELIHVA